MFAQFAIVVDKLYQLGLESKNDEALELMEQKRQEYHGPNRRN